MKISYDAKIKNGLLLCKRCKCFIHATQNVCVCGYDPVDSHGMVKED